MFIPLSFRLLNIFQQNRCNEYTPDHTKKQLTFIATTYKQLVVYIIPSHIYLRCLLLAHFPFACEFQCTTHQLSVTRRKNLSKQNLHIMTTNRTPYIVVTS
jgi:hypothetical protein